MSLTDLRQKYMDVCLETQINNVKRTCSGDTSTSQISKHFPNDSNHPLNKWHTDFSDERMIMINYYDIWGLMVVYNQGTLSIIYIPTFVSNRASDTFIRCFCGASLGTKLEVDINTDSLLETASTVDSAQIDSPNSILPPPNINRNENQPNQ